MGYQSRSQDKAHTPSTETGSSSRPCSAFTALVSQAPRRGCEDMGRVKVVGRTLAITVERDQGLGRQQEVSSSKTFWTIGTLLPDRCILTELNNIVCV